MRFKLRECDYHKPSSRRYVVEAEGKDATEYVLELSKYDPFKGEPGDCLFTRSEATYLCALMNDLFANVSSVMSIEECQNVQG